MRPAMIFLVTAAFGMLPLLAHADPIVSRQLHLLDTFNLIDFGDRVGQSESEGRIWIGGNLSGSLANAGFNGGLVPSSDATVTVNGSVAAGTYANVQSGGISIGGDQAGTFNLNGSAGSVSQVGGNVANMSLNGGALQLGGVVQGNLSLNAGATKQTVPGLVAGIPASNFATLQALTGTLDAQAANGNVAVVQGTAYFSGPGSGSQAVFRIADGAAFFNGLSGIVFSLGSNITGVTVNVDGGAQSIDDRANILYGQNLSLASLLLWNFNNTAALTLDTDFGGTILAPSAAVLNNSDIEGTLVAGSFNQNAELHAHYYTGGLPSAGPTPTPPVPAIVPEPASLAALALGLLTVVGLVLHRRRR